MPSLRVRRSCFRYTAVTTNSIENAKVERTLVKTLCTKVQFTFFPVLYFIISKTVRRSGKEY